MKQSTYIIEKLPESILKFLDSDRGTIFFIVMLLLLIVGVVVAIRLRLDVKKANSKLKEMERYSSHLETGKAVSK